ncbi:conjugative transposon TraJ protein [Bacteroides sp. HPS0048]|uniref:conjugative transposon protein TraJ n=1 Tax=Bacteroides sp. HPS0048 TaxID=1078089 RepID=UPI00037E67A2|nr:conjugative transposon protein TraJ [Bacteroides sp. HPS0048]EOA56098.1 conjugative transposon TraJ protein [Bacteroides sp. HPS0048]
MMLLAIDFENLHQILRNLYTEMMPLCSDMVGVAKGIAGLGALFYVAYRVWQQLSRAEPIDVYPLLRPFVIGFCIMFFPTVVLGTINSVMSPIVKGTNNMLGSQTLSMEEHRQKRDKLEYEAMKRNPETAYLVDKPTFDEKLEKLGAFDAIEICGMYIDRAMYNAKKGIQNWFKELLELLFQAAALVIDTIRTFFLVVLAILGPIAFAISVWDGFQSSLVQWITRYLSVYLWLPVSDLFSSILARIQVLMLDQDIKQLEDATFIPDGSNTVYIIFMIIGIVGYFTIPTVANWIISAGGMGSYGKNVNSTATKAGSVVAGAAGSAVGNVAGRLLKR